VVSRDNQERLCESKALQRQQMCGVSNAFWPADARCSVHTNKVAQLRRICIMIAIECINIWGLWKVYWQYLTSITMSLHRLVQIIFIGGILGTAVVLAAFYDWGALLKHWFIFVLCVVSCVFVTLLVIYAWIDNRRTRKNQPLVLNISHSSLAGIPVSQMDQTPPSPLSDSGPSVPKTQLPTLLPFPDTPVPVSATPLIRVLETIDLSSTNVKHFLDIRPHSSMNITKDIDGK
jgi:hypothetical protein